jgi:hypothetical protein
MSATATESMSEDLAYGILNLVAKHPGRYGRMRVTRIVGGFVVPERADDTHDLLTYAVENDWTIRDLVCLVDALIHGGLIEQTPGPRPTLVLPIAGFRAYDALHRARRAVAA